MENPSLMEASQRRNNREPMLPTPTQLNQRFPADSVTFESGKGGLTRCQVSNPFATAEFYLHGAHLTAYQPVGGEPLLWLSDQALFQAGKPIRGGIPICWPWFNRHVSGDPAFPQHGFARTSQWGVRAVLETDQGTEIFLGLTSLPNTQRWLPGQFDARYRMRIGTSLTVELSLTNTGDQTLENIGAALHTYFSVSQIENVQVSGLENTRYLDQLDGQNKTQQGSLKFAQEVDRVYFPDQHRPIQLNDSGRGRTLEIQSGGSRSTVAWNPWVQKSRAMADFPETGYQTMVCLETANAFEDCRTIQPGETHILSQTITPLVV